MYSPSIMHSPSIMKVPDVHSKPIKIHKRKHHDRHDPEFGSHRIINFEESLEHERTNRSQIPFTRAHILQRAAPTNSMLHSTPNSTPVVARLLLPDDANVSGNVHGGTILQLMEQAGMIAATRHVNSSPNGTSTRKQMAGLARIETMTFHQPMFVGEVASVGATVCFTSERSVLVQVTVRAENAVAPHTEPRITNTGLLWYVSYVAASEDSNGTENQPPPNIVTVPQLPVPNKNGDATAWKEYQQFQALYDARKHKLETRGADAATTSCLNAEGCLCPNCRTSYTLGDDPTRTPTTSHQRLCQLVLPSDCGTNNICFGGFVMKLMDNAAGCCAFSHCRTNVVTVSIGSMDFASFVHCGDIVTIDARLVYCSPKSMEIAVTASVVSATQMESVTVASGTFTFVSLDAKHKVMAVPLLQYETEEELNKAYAAQRRFAAAKMARMAKVKTLAEKGTPPTK